MNTLITDLKLLIENHLTIVEDNFLNYVVNTKTKNIKHAVRENNWKSILYYLQRYRYQKNICQQAFHGACQQGNLKLMNLFRPDGNLISGARHLAKYKHYDLIDSLLVNNRLAYHRLQILQGLIASNDLETIKSGKYIDFNRNPIIIGNFIASYAYLIYKYNRIEILEYINSKIPGIFDQRYCQSHIVMGKAKGNQDLDLAEVKSAFDETNPFPNNTIKILTESGYHDIVERMIASIEYEHYKNEFKTVIFHPDYFDSKRALYIINLFKIGRNDLAEKYILKYHHRKDIIMMMVAIGMDDLDLFNKHYEDGLVSFYSMVQKAIDNSAYRVLQIILDLHKNEDIKLEVLVSDPRVVDILKQELTNGRKIKPYPNFFAASKEYGYNLIFDILHQ